MANAKLLTALSLPIDDPLRGGKSIDVNLALLALHDRQYVRQRIQLKGQACLDISVQR